MTYRSDADAARSRIPVLEAELAAEQEQLGRLRAAAAGLKDLERWEHQTYLARMGMCTIAVINVVLLLLVANL